MVPCQPIARHCERSEAIYPAPMDCRASLAMTAKQENAFLLGFGLPASRRHDVICRSTRINFE
jgi:hypothetical protein